MTLEQARARRLLREIGLNWPPSGGFGDEYGKISPQALETFIQFDLKNFPHYVAAIRILQSCPGNEVKKES